MASLRLTTAVRRIGVARFHHNRAGRCARQMIFCSVDISFRRTLHSRILRGNSGKVDWPRCHPALLRFWTYASLALLQFPKTLHIPNRAPNEDRNAFIIGTGRCRITFEQESPLLHGLDPCLCRIRKHLVFEAFQMRLRRWHRRQPAMGGSPPFFCVMSFSRSPATVKIDRVISHGSVSISAERLSLTGLAIFLCMTSSFSDAWTPAPITWADYTRFF